MKVGYGVRSNDGVIGTSGTPKVIFGVNFLSGAGGVGTVDIHDGTSTSGTKVFSLTGTASQATTIDFGIGVVLPSGCYLNIDANVSSVTVFYQEGK